MRKQYLFRRNSNLIVYAEVKDKITCTIIEIKDSKIVFKGKSVKISSNTVNIPRIEELFNEKYIGTFNGNITINKLKMNFPELFI